MNVKYFNIYLLTKTVGQMG